MNVHWPSPADVESWFVLGLVAKATLVLALAAGLTLAARRSSADVRHRIWAVTFMGLLLLPAASALFPELAWPVIPREESSPAIAHAALPPATQPTAERPQAATSTGRTDAPMQTQPHSEIVVDARAIAIDAFPDRRITEPADIKTVGFAGSGPASAAAQPPVHWLLWTWLVGGVLCVLPLVVGLSANLHMRLGTRRLEGLDWQPLVARLSQQLGLRRPVLLVIGGPRQMPMTFGLWRPCVVLPADAETWSLERRQVVLLHELGHIQRYDVPLQMIARLACAVYWFHPLAWWALRQMRVEREHACDDAVLRAGQKASGYAAELLEIARAHSNSSVLLNAALSMARPSQLEGRLLAVLDAGRCRTPVGPRWTGGLLTLTAAVICALGAVRPTATADGPAVVERYAASIHAPASIGSHDQQMVIAGIVRTPNGKPAVGATIEVIAHNEGGNWTRMTPGDTGIDHYQTKTDGTGHFRLGVPRSVSHPRPYLSVLASDRDRHVAMGDTSSDALSKGVELKFEEPKTVRMRIIDAVGNPVAGVTPELEYTQLKSNINLWSNSHQLFRSVAAGWPRFTPSDAQGYASIVVPASSQTLSVLIANDQVGSKSVRVDLSKEPVSVALKPPRFLNGRVLDAQSSRPIVGAEVLIMEQPYRRVLTSADGTFRAPSGETIRGLFRTGECAIHVYPPADSPNLFQAIEWEWPNKGIGDGELTVRLPQGVMVEGQVVEKGTGKPVAGATLTFDQQQKRNPYFHDEARCRFTDAEMKYATGADGRFRMPVWPGPGWLQVNGPSLDYVHQKVTAGEKWYGKTGLEREYYDGIVKVNFKPGERPAPLVIELERGATVKRQVVLPDGKPASGAAYCRSYLRFKHNINQSLPQIPVEDGLLEVPGFEPERTNPVYVVDRNCEYGATVSLRNDEPEGKTIQLERCGKVRMRIVDGKGKPVPGFLPFVFVVVTPGAPATHHIEPNQPLWLDSMNWWGTLKNQTPKTDADGRVTIGGMIPGATYQVSYPGGSGWTSGHEFHIRPGETTDIGDIVLPKQG